MSCLPRLVSDFRLPKKWFRVPKGQIQPQKKRPKKRVGIRTRRLQIKPLVEGAAGERVGDSDQRIQLEEQLDRVRQADLVSPGLERAAELGAEQEQHEQEQKDDLR